MANNLSPAQFKVLGYLRAACGPWGDREVQICVNDLARDLGLNRSTVSRALKHLSNESLIEMELIRIGVKISAAALKGYRECDSAIASCDRTVTSCDPAIASCDPAIASTIYKYIQLFSNPQLAGEKDLAEFRVDGDTGQVAAALINQLEDLLKKSHQHEGQFPAAGFKGNIHVESKGPATGFEGSIKIDANGPATGFEGDIEVKVEQGPATGFDGNIQVEAEQGPATGFDGNIRVEAEQGPATGFDGNIRVEAEQGPATGFDGNIQVEAERGAAKGFKGDIKVSSRQAKQEIWEIAPGEPYPVFLNWRAAGMSKQEGHWQENAYRFSYSEFYNNRVRTTKILWPEFLATVKQVTFASQQALAVGMQPVLPSWFIEKPAPTLENAQQVMSELQAVIAQGVQVAMPQKALTASCQQTMSYAAATMVPQVVAAPSGENASAYALFQPANLPAPSAPPEGFFQELAQKLAMRKQSQPQQQFQGVATDSFEKYKPWMQDPVLRKEAASWAYKQDSVRIVFDEEGNPYDLERI